MNVLFLSYVMTPRSLSGYTAAVIFLLLGLTFGGLLLAGREFSYYRFSDDKLHRTNGLLWLSGAGMSLFTLLFVLMRRGWLMGVVFLIGGILVSFTVGDGVRDQLRHY